MSIRKKIEIYPCMQLYTARIQAITTYTCIRSSLNTNALFVCKNICVRCAGSFYCLAEFIDGDVVFVFLQLGSQLHCRGDLIKFNDKSLRLNFHHPLNINQSAAARSAQTTTIKKQKIVVEPVGMWSRSQRVWSSCG